MDSLQHLNPVLLAFLFSSMTWLFTAVGAALVFVNKNPSRRFFDSSLGFAGGIMVAASFFSLLLPAIELTEGKTPPAWFVVSVGFIIGCLFMYILDKVVPHLHLNLPESEKEGPSTNLSVSYLLILAITLHNIPEGLAIGVAFGSLKFPSSGITLAMAASLAFGIGIQDLPEGMAVSVPLRGAGFSKWKAFWYGQLSGVVEPIAGVIGALAVSFFKPMLPYALAFAAGAMLYIVVEEVIPETQRAGNTDIATLSFLGGFVIMMVLDVAFG
ncbi:ZIP family metal transporter [bacterium]|nr:ZIP family metal transporter [bacterium]